MNRFISVYISVYSCLSLWLSISMCRFRSYDCLGGFEWVSKSLKMVFNHWLTHLVMLRTDGKWWKMMISNRIRGCASTCSKCVRSGRIRFWWGDRSVCWLSLVRRDGSKGRFSEMVLEDGSRGWFGWIIQEDWIKMIRAVEFRGWRVDFHRMRITLQSLSQ